MYKKFYSFTSIKQESSFLSAIKLPRISYAVGSLEGLLKIGVIKVPLTIPKSNNLLFKFPFAFYIKNLARFAKRHII